MRSTGSKRALFAGLLGAAVLGLTGCVSGPSASIQPPHDVHLEQDSLSRRAREMTLRVRNVDCLSVGSSFAITDHVLVTNRHVTDGAGDLEVETWDGRSIPVKIAGIATVNDLSLIFVDGELPVHATLASHDLPSGSHVYAVGFPHGGRLRVTDGRIASYVDGAPFDEAGSIIRGDFPVQHGNSGGPLLDDHGQVVGVVFALESSTGLSLAIPQSSLRALINHPGFDPVDYQCQ